MVEHLFRTWAKLDGTWDVTHHSQTYGTGGKLGDVAKDFKNFKTRKAAEDYIFNLAKRVIRKGNSVEVESPDTMGREVPGGWMSYHGKSWWANFGFDGDTLASDFKGDGAEEFVRKMLAEKAAPGLPWLGYQERWGKGLMVNVRSHPRVTKSGKISTVKEHMRKV
ncbi:MAG: hypothetical protein AM326_12410 [Candidatus Thorarchaeota archaeon SMTZ-45]|nr:MAG: hypothetical protein AM326_12410 [Candidatus Thorarchaeota archaeon SMTZ-45]